MRVEWTEGPAACAEETREGVWYLHRYGSDDRSRSCLELLYRQVWRQQTPQRPG